MSDARYVPALRFRALTAIYDPAIRVTTREARFKHRLLELAAIDAGERVLDLGCGTGTLAIEAKRRQPQAQIVGLDGDPEILERARRKAEAAGVEVAFDEAFSDDLSYEESSFDVVTSTLFFHHLTDDVKLATVREVARVLRPGGRLAVADWGRPSGPVMGAASWAIRAFDGFAQTRANFRGELPDVFEAGGLRKAAEADRLRTIFGSLSFYEARA